MNTPSTDAGCFSSDKKELENMSSAIMEIDLHGLTAAEAQVEIDRALSFADSGTYKKMHTWLQPRHSHQEYDLQGVRPRPFKKG